MIRGTYNRYLNFSFLVWVSMCYAIEVILVITIPVGRQQYGSANNAHFPLGGGFFTR